MKIILTLLVVILFNVPGHCFIIDSIMDVINWSAKQVNEIEEAIFRKTMIAQTITSVAQLKKTYDDSVAFYSDMKRISEDPAGFGQDVFNQFTGRLNNPVQTFWDKVDQNARAQKGVQEAVQEDLNYVKQNWNFGDKIAKKIDEQDKQMQKLPGKLSSTNKQTVDDAKTQIQLLQLEQQNQTNKLLLKLVESETRREHTLLIDQQKALARQNLAYQTTVKVLKDREYGLSTGRHQNIKRMLNE